MNPEKFLENFSTHLKNTIARAISLAAGFGHADVTPVHLLLSLTDQKGCIAGEILARVGIDREAITSFLESTTISATEEAPAGSVTATLPTLNLAAKQTLERAMLLAYEREHTYVGTEHLLYGIVAGREKSILALLKNRSVDQKAIVSEIETILQSTSKFPEIDDVREVMEQLKDIVGSNDEPAAPERQQKQKKNPSAIDVFTTNLTHRQMQKQIDPVIGREKEIERIIHILSRRTKNNPILVGEPGVGKTAIIEGLAKRIAAGDIPDILKRKKILSLDLTLLIAGTIYRGEFEARLKQLIDELGNHPDSILFIDEIHNIIGAGSNQGTMDAANILKPALARGQLRCIGATTLDEYKKHIAQDPALERRFQAIMVEEPSKDDTIAILHGIKKYYEDFHHTTITDEAIQTAVDVSTRYIHDNFLPDKAIDLIDEASALVRTKEYGSQKNDGYTALEYALEECRQKKEDAIHKERFEDAIRFKEQEKKLHAKLHALEKDATKQKKKPRKKVLPGDVMHVLSNKLNIKEEFITTDEWTELRAVEDRIRARIVGQDAIVTTVIETLQQASLRLQKNKRPLASFLFAGPSGVGKTELAKVLAEEVYHDPAALIKFDMSEFAEAHGVSKLLGSPAGYIGHKERNRFTDEIKKRPYAVILFDEFDKAHPDVQKLLYQILDEGELTDSNGKKIHFHHAIIILTTNIGAEFFKSAGIGFGRDHTSRARLISKGTDELIRSKLKETFQSALLGRINQICIFSPLTNEQVQSIVRHHLDAFIKELRSSRAVTIVPDAAAIETIARSVYNDDTGVRNVEYTLQHILQKALNQILHERKRKKQYTLLHDAGTYHLR